MDMQLHIGNCCRASINVDGSSVMTGQDVQTIVTKGNASVFSSDGVAVDWLFKRVYWTEFNVDKIMLADYEGKNQHVVISTGLEDPRAIALDPEYG